MLNARFLIIAALLFLAGVLDAGASISKTRVGNFLTPAPMLTAPESSQVLDTPLENWTLYDGTVSGRPFGFVDGPNMYAYVVQNPWTKFDPEGLKEKDLNEVRQDGKVRINEAMDLKMSPKESEGVLKQYNKNVTKPEDISSDRVGQLSGTDQYKGKSEEEVRVGESARQNSTQAKLALLQNEGDPHDAKLMKAYSALMSLTVEAAAIPFNGVRAPGALLEGAVAGSKPTLSKQLQNMTTQMAGEVDAQGLGAFTPRQIAAMSKNPNLAAMFRGSAIDAGVRDLVSKNPELRNLLVGQSNKGVDFTNVLTKQRYDMTTPAAFPAHVQKYGNQPSPIILLDTTK